MLHFAAVKPASTLAILKSLMQMETLDCFNLAGGTALALHYGHRISVDLDFFTEKEFLCDDLLSDIESNFEVKIQRKQRKNQMTLFLSNHGFPETEVKVDFLRYPYKLIDQIISVDGLRLLSPKDIAPMKLSAISNRGAKKDFFDLYKLLEEYTLQDLLNLFTLKYPNISHFMVLKSLTYFEDVENDFDPILLENVSWNEVKAIIIKKTMSFLKGNEN
jgi:predicted nucleotidyltransferase component of viral defense system